VPVALAAVAELSVVVLLLSGVAMSEMRPSVLMSQLLLMLLAHATVIHVRHKSPAARTASPTY
jgi:hypothetical protein